MAPVRVEDETLEAPAAPAEEVVEAVRAPVRVVVAGEEVLEDEVVALPDDARVDLLEASGAGAEAVAAIAEEAERGIGTSIVGGVEVMGDRVAGESAPSTSDGNSPEADGNSRRKRGRR